MIKYWAAKHYIEKLWWKLFSVIFKNRSEILKWTIGCGDTWLYILFCWSTSKIGVLAKLQDVFGKSRNRKGRSWILKILIFLCEFTAINGTSSPLPIIKKEKKKFFILPCCGMLSCMWSGWFLRLKIRHKPFLCRYFKTNKITYFW